MKAMIVSGLVGVLFMAGGFYYGMEIAPKPAVMKPAAVATGTTAAGTTAGGQANPSPITLDTLEKTSQTMMSLNEALRVREEAVAQREARVQEREDELDAERATLNDSHEKFKTLFNEFQSRLQLVEANQAAQLQKEADLYTTMGFDQSVDLVRVMDDPAISRLFSVMDTKPLGKMIAAWKTKYPQDAPRLLRVLDGMAQVMPKEKIALTDDSSGGTSDSGTPAGSTDNSTPTTDDSSSTTPAPTADPNASPASSAPAPDTSATPAAATTDPSAPAAAAPAPPDGTQAAPSSDPSAAPTNPQTTPTAPTDSTPPLSPPADPSPTPGKPQNSTAST